MTNLEMYQTLNTTEIDGQTLPILVDDTNHLNYAIEVFNSFNFTRTTLEQWVLIGGVNHYFKANKNNKQVVGEEGLNWKDHIKLSFKGINEHQISKSIFLYNNSEKVLKWYETSDITAQNIRTVIDAYNKETAVPTSKRLEKKKTDEKKTKEEETALNSLVQRFTSIINETIKFTDKLEEDERTTIKELIESLNI